MRCSSKYGDQSVIKRYQLQVVITDDVSLKVFMEHLIRPSGVCSGIIVAAACALPASRKVA